MLSIFCHCSLRNRVAVSAVHNRRWTFFVIPWICRGRKFETQISFIPDMINQSEFAFRIMHFAKKLLRACEKNMESRTDAEREGLSSFFRIDLLKLSHCCKIKIYCVVLYFMHTIGSNNCERVFISPVIPNRFRVIAQWWETKKLRKIVQSQASQYFQEQASLRDYVSRFIAIWSTPR